MLVELADRVRCREVSAVELVREALRRIERDDKSIGAVTSLRADAALDEAAALDRRIAAGRDPGPLAGLPVLVKELDDVAGLRTTHGSRLLAGAAPARSDGRVPSRLKTAGAVIIGKSNIPEFCFEGYSANPLFGATRNPWNLEYSPGGSSGGSGAALAAGLVPVATASDGGGSIRIPAAFCGLVGLKPTNGLIGRGAAPAWLDLMTDGPISQTVADARLLLGLVTGPSPADIYAAPPLPVPPGRLPERVLTAPRLASGKQLPPAIADLFAAALDALEKDLHIPVKTVDPGRLFSSGDIDADWYLLAAAEQAQALGQLVIEEHEDLFDAVFLQALHDGLSVSLPEYVAARRRRWDYARELHLLLGDDGVLVSPTMTLEGFLPDGRLPGEDGSQPPHATPNEAYNTNAANMTGAPAVSLPAGRCPNGLPFGLQVIAPRFREDLLLGIAAAWEQARPWPLTADGYTPFGE